MVAQVGFEPTSQPYEGHKETSPLPRNISGSFTSLTTRLAFYFGEIGLTENSQLDYPRFEEFSDDSFSFSVISFYELFFCASLLWLYFIIVSI